MSRDNHTEIKQFAIDLQNASQKASKIITDETANYVKKHHNYNNIIDYAKAHIKSRFEYEAEFLTELGYAKASEVAEEIFAELDKRLDDITIVMGRLDSLRTFHKTMEKVTAEVAELKKKYTENKGE